MKLPSRLFRSRHGVFYFRIQYHVESKRVDRRFSLQTKSPTVAKAKALQISAIMARSKKAGADMSRFNPDDPSTWDGVLGEKDSHRKLDIELPNGGGAIRNINTLEEREYADKVIQQFIQIKSAEDQARFAAGYNSQIVPNTTPAQPEEPQGGMTIGEIIKRFATRNANVLTERTLYEYGNYQRHFSAWFATRKRKKNLPIRMVTREDVAVYIDDLLAKPVSPTTIKQKYMAALNGLFTLAQSSGAFPSGDIPTKGHKIISKAKVEERQEKTGWRVFTNQDLIQIFNPESYLAQTNPADFWLPLLGLFTGARIEELCQLIIDEDIKPEDEEGRKVWTLSITDLSENENEKKQVKSSAARRNIPLHPKLIELGFLDYVKDARQFGTRIFPYLTPDRFGKYHCTPSERFGKYLDSINMTHSAKVFHSFRKTSNNKLKKSRVSEEERCQFVGHKHESTNSYVYGEDFDIPYLLENVANKLIFDLIDFSPLTYKPGQFTKRLDKLCQLKESRKNHREARLARKQMKKTS